MSPATWSRGFVGRGECDDGRFESWPHAKLVRAVYAGLLVAGTIAFASTWLAHHYTTPVMLFALLFGMSFHFLYEGGRTIVS